ncbi:hypothetical protein ACFQV2_03540 [Actinokineospora soli]|uniref:Uncharacterized protein n=1 Tax=Actinokineospora soli TaxID=1048753 RepID=A0ABW2TIG9_9PSEU
MDTRNPYLLLGVDYGADPDTARRSFARAARRVRRSGTAAISIEDLNWALHEIQRREGDPADSVTVYRVPANPAVFDVAGTGTFAPRPLPLERRTAVTDADREQLMAGLADEVWELLGASLPGIARFDHGYDQPGRKSR